MTVQPGYKQTEVGIVPDDFVVASIGELCNSVAARDLVKAHFSEQLNADFPYPIYSNAHKNRGLYGYSNSYQFEADRITVTARGNIGHAEYRSAPFCAIGRLLVLAAKRDVDLRLLAELINSFVEFALESTGVPQLTSPQIAS